MGNLIEDKMEKWHDKFDVPITNSDKKFYKDLGDKYNFKRYPENTEYRWSERGCIDAKAIELRKCGTGREYLEYMNNKQIEESSKWLNRQKEFIHLVDLTGEHTGMGKWNWKDKLRWSMGAFGVVSSRRKYKIKNSHWIGSRD